MTRPALGQLTVEAAVEAQAPATCFDIHGLMGVRLVDPAPADLATVGRHLGLQPCDACSDVGVAIRFVDALPVKAPLRYLGRNDVAFTQERFILLRSRNLARARATLEFESIGKSIDITCERNLPAIPLLRQLINLAMLARGIVPVHAAAFEFDGRGVLVTGWSHGSKTGTLLAFMDLGAQFVGDEWIYLSAGRDRMYGLPDQLEARSWYLDELPGYWRQVPTSDRLRLAAAAWLSKLVKPFVDGSERRNSLVGKIVRAADEVLAGQQSVHVSPAKLFGSGSCALAAPVDIVIVAVSHEAPEVVVEPTSSERAARQMAASFVHEQESLLACYRKYRFAFPDRRSGMLDELEDIYVDAALRALAGKSVSLMLHPYPPSVESLRSAVSPLLSMREPSA